MNKFTTVSFVLLGLGLSSTSHAISLSQVIYDVPEPSVLVLAAIGIAAVVAKKLIK